MHRLLLLISLGLLVTGYPGRAAEAQGNAYPPGAYPPGPPPPPPPGARPGPGARGPAYNQENCGTPDEPKPCPPLPRVPLQVLSREPPVTHGPTRIGIASPAARNDGGQDGGIGQSARGVYSAG